MSPVIAGTLAKNPRKVYREPGPVRRTFAPARIPSRPRPSIVDGRSHLPWGEGFTRRKSNTSGKQAKNKIPMSSKSSM